MNSSTRRSERAVCDKRAARQVNSDFLDLAKHPTTSQEEYKILVALQSHSELNYMITQIYAFCKDNRLGYIVAYESPLFEFNLPQNNYFLVSLSIKRIKDHPTVYALVDIPETIPLQICPLKNINIVLGALSRFAKEDGVIADFV